MLPEERDAAAVFGEIHGIADLDPVADHSRGEPAPAVERDDHQLIRRVGDELLRRGVDQCFGVNNSGTGVCHIVPRIVTTAVAPEPPKFWASPSECRSI